MRDVVCRSASAVRVHAAPMLAAHRLTIGARLLLLLLVAAACMPIDAFSATGSTTPYANLYQVLAPALEIAKFDRLVALQRVRSREAGVDPHDIHIMILAKSGPVNIAVATDGSVEFPVTGALKAENPDVETNQPKGSLALTVNAALRVPDATTLPWRDVDAALSEAEALFAKSSNASAPKAIAGIEIDFGTHVPASVTLTGKGERLFTAGADGQIIIARDAVIDPDHAVLEFSRRPMHILPYVAP